MFERINFPTRARLTTDLLPDIDLTHGRVLWVLRALGFGDDTFQHYIKSLRKLACPIFVHGTIGGVHITALIRDHDPVVAAAAR